MKRIFYLRGWLMPALLILALPVLAQVAAPPTKPDKGRDDNQHPVDTAKLALGEALYQQGRFKDAESLFGYIRRYDKQDKSAPDYVAALYYDALCRYALEDWRGFADAAGSPWLQKADLTPELRADLDGKRVGAIYFSGDFEGVLSNAADFYAAHPGSPEVRGVLEFQMASLYERGVKKFYGSGDQTKTNALSQDCAAAEKGYSNLVEFLNVAVALDEDNYQAVPRRNLTSELKQALTALEWEGNFTNEDAAAIRQSLRNDPRLQEETMPDTMQADIELRHDEIYLQLHQFKEVLAGIGDFAQRHPDSKHLWTASEYQMAALYEGGIKKLAQAGYLKGVAWTTRHYHRVQYDMGEAAFEEGWRSRKAADLDLAHDLLSGVVEDKTNGVAAADVQEARVGIMCIYFAKRDWTNLCGWADQMTTNAPPGGKDWLVTKLYHAVGLSCQHKFTEAAGELDEALATGFKGNPSYDGLLLSAATWRVNIALRLGDQATAQRIAQQVQGSICYGSIKRGFVKQFQSLMPQTNSITK